MKKTGKLLCLVLMCFAVKGKAQTPPSWSVTPTDFQYTSTMTAALIFQGTPLDSGQNLLAAFVDNEIRGVAQPTGVGNTSMYFLTIYSNIASGETVHFQAYVENEDSIYQIIDSIAFSNGSTYGTPTSPYELKLTEGNSIYFLPFDPNKASEQSIFDPIYLPDHISNPDYVPVKVEVIQSGMTLSTSVQNDSLYVNHDGRIGIDTIWLALLDSADMTQVHDTAVVLFEVTSANEPISFELIPDQYWGFNSDSCIDLTSYLINSDNDSIHWQVLPAPIDSIGSSVVNWHINPADFQYSMNVIAEVSIQGNGLGRNSFQLGAFDENDTLRGLSHTQYVNGRWINYLTIYSNVPTGMIHFQLWDSSYQQIYEEQTLNVSFKPDSIIGNANHPLNMYVGDYSYDWNGGILCFRFFGNNSINIDSLRIVATEALTSDQYADTTVFSLLYVLENEPRLEEITDQTVFIGEPFSLFDLDNYLIELDDDPVLYSVADTAYLTMWIDSAHVVHTLPKDSLWTGSDTIRIIVKDSTDNQLFSHTELVFTVLSSPVMTINGIADQSINLSESFAAVYLPDYMTYSHPDRVNWEVSLKELTGLIQDSTLKILFPTSGWTGSDTLIIKAYDQTNPQIFDLDTAVFSIHSSVSILEDIHTEISLYPNPNKGQFVIEGAKIMNIEIFNIMGKQVYHYVGNTDLHKVNLQLGQGLYFVKITIPEKILIHPLLVE